MFGSILVTGASRGLGFEFIKQLVGQTKYLFAACRSPKDAKKLNELAASNSNIHVIEIDVTNESTIKSAYEKVHSILGDNGLNVLINNAGLYTTDDKSITLVDHDVMKNIWNVNVAGSALMCKHFSPMVKQAASINSNEGISMKRAALIQLGSGYGRITDCSSSGVYAYKMSKAAVVMLTKNLSNEFKNDILCVTIEPGWVQTDMGGSQAAITPEESVLSMLTVLMKLNGDNNGQSWRYDGGQVNY